MAGMSKTYRVTIVPDEATIGEWVEPEDIVMMDRIELVFTIGDKAGTGNRPFDPPKFTPEALAEDALAQLHLRRWMKVSSVEQLNQADIIGLRSTPQKP
jgi:hypothetical protein